MFLQYNIRSVFWRSKMKAVTAIILSALLTFANAQDDIGCYVDGQCVGANFNNQDESETPDLCHQLCIDTPDCLYWTHIIDGDNFFCFSYTNCPEFETDCGEQTCVSGELECPIQGQCEFIGRCEGGEVQLYFDIGSVEECAQLCSCNDDCTFYTYDSSDSTCNLVNDCAFIDETCDTCTSGEDGCDSSTTCELTTESNLFMECPSEFVPTNPETTTVGPRGCNVDFLRVDEVCVISSPGFPDFYEDSACKEWSLRPATEGAPITISFDQFDLECTYDSVGIYDGNNSLAPVLARYDGCDTPFDVTATSGNMFVTFHTDSSVTHHGFKATITSE